MSANLFAFYAACTALLVFVLAALVAALLRRGDTRRAAPDVEGAVVAVYRDQLREVERDLAAGTLTAEQAVAMRLEIAKRLGEDLARAPAAAAVSAAPAASAAAPAASAAAPAAPAAATRARLAWPSRTVAIAAVTIVVVCAAAWALYAKLGAPIAIDSAQMPTAPRGPAGAPAAAPSAPLPSMDTLAQRLALKMRTQTPDDGEGWALLARSYVELKQYREASDAFSKAVKRIPNDATLLADYADALGMANGKSLRGEPAALVQRALKVDPKHPKALALAASAAFDEKNYRQAIAYWEKLRAVLPPDSDEVKGVEANIAEANDLLSGKSPSLAAALAAATAPEAAAGGGTISGTVRMAPGLAAKVAPGDFLMIYAKPVAKSGPPLAIVRVPAALPYSFRLDDGQAMLPELKLSSVSEVVLTARVSHAGGATPQSGDLQGIKQPVKVGAKDVDVVVDQVVP